MDILQYFYLSYFLNNIRYKSEGYDFDRINNRQFCRGGGASTGIEMAIGRSVDVAINHDPNAIAMHFERKRPLAENTMKRIARGFKKFVQDEANPFIVRIGQTGFGGDKLSYSLNQPLTTITTKAEHLLVTPTIMVNNTRHSGSSLKNPLPTITTAGNQALVSTFLEKEEDTLAASYLVKHYGGNYSGAGIDLRNPTDTITQVDHHALVQAFLIKYYGSDTGQRLNEPLHTIPTKDRFGLVQIKNENYCIVDITMRMLQPHELSKAQGLPEDYIIDKDPEGKKVSKAVQTARIGNMVVPQCAKALVQANLPELCQQHKESKSA